MTNGLEFLSRFSGVFNSYRLNLSLAVNTFVCVLFLLSLAIPSNHRQVEIDAEFAVKASTSFI